MKRVWSCYKYLLWFNSIFAICTSHTHACIMHTCRFSEWSVWAYFNFYHTDSKMEAVQHSFSYLWLQRQTCSDWVSLQFVFAIITFISTYTLNLSSIMNHAHPQHLVAHPNLYYLNDSNISLPCAWLQLNILVVIVIVCGSLLPWQCNAIPPPFFYIQTELDHA